MDNEAHAVIIINEISADNVMALLIKDMAEIINGIYHFEHFLCFLFRDDLW
jgi:hypothetical protein